MTQPVVYMIAGPNGAGKTTAAMKLLPDFLSIHEFVNADEMARGLNPLNPDGQGVAAGRLMLQRIDNLIAEGKSFAFETTGASHVFADKLKQAKEQGYRLGLVYLWLPNAAFANKRVQFRVVQGGHHIPEDTVERRYSRGLYNLVNSYLPLVDQASIIDSTSPVTNEAEIIAQKNDTIWQIMKPDSWDAILKSAGDKEI